MDLLTRTDPKRAAAVERRRNTGSRRRFFMPDPLAHFKNEGPGWKLAAFAISKLPPTLFAFAFAFAFALILSQLKSTT